MLRAGVIEELNATVSLRGRVKDGALPDDVIAVGVEGGIEPSAQMKIAAC